MSILSKVIQRTRDLWADAPLAVLGVPAATISVLVFDGRVGSGHVHHLALWLTALLVGVVILGLVGAAPHHRAEVLRCSSISTVDEMDGVAFEHRLQSLYEYLGFTVETTATSGDFGADLVLIKNGERTVVQAKRYSSNVGIEAVQQAVGARAHYTASGAVVATNSFFTKAARQLAASNSVELIDRDCLTALLLAQSGNVGVATGGRLIVGQVACGIGPAIRCLVSLLGLGVRILLGCLRFGLAIWR